MSADPRALLATLVTHLNAIWIIIGFLLWGRFSSSKNLLSSSVFGAVTPLARLRIIPSAPCCAGTMGPVSPQPQTCGRQFPTDHRNCPCPLHRKIPLSVLPS